MDATRGEQNDSKLKLFKRFLQIYWKIIFAVVWPLFLGPFVLAYNMPVPKQLKRTVWYGNSVR